MGRPETIPMKAWTIWLDLIQHNDPGTLITSTQWTEAAGKHGAPTTRQALAPYLAWLDDFGYINRVHGGFNLSWGRMETSVVNPDGMFVTRPDGENVQVLSAERVRELGLWNDEPSADDPDVEWEPIMSMQFSTRLDDPEWGTYLRKKAEYLRGEFPEPARLQPLGRPPKAEPVAVDYLDDIHWYFLNSLGYKVGDLVDLDTWRLILAHDFGSVISDEHATEYHGLTAIEVFSEATYLAERLGLVRIEPGGVRLRKAPRKTVGQPDLRSSARNLVD